MFTDPDQLQSLAVFFTWFRFPLDLATEGKRKEALELTDQDSNEPFDALYGMRAAADLLYTWEATQAGGDESDSLTSRTSVYRLCEEIQREGSDAVTAALVGLVMIGYLALEELGFHETLDFILLRAEIDARRNCDDVACPSTAPTPSGPSSPSTANRPSPATRCRCITSACSNPAKRRSSQGTGG